MITNEVYFFKNQSSVSTSDSLYNVNDGTLILQVDGNVSNLELLVLGNTDLIDDDFVALKTINASDYSMSDKITSTGIYWIDINGIRKIKLNLSKITGSVNVKALTKRGLTTDLVARAMAANASGGSSYTLPVASADTLGGIKIGENLSIDENGVVSASGGDVPRLYSCFCEKKCSVGGGFYLQNYDTVKNMLEEAIENYVNNQVIPICSFNFPTNNRIQYIANLKGSLYAESNSISFPNQKQNYFHIDSDRFVINQNIYYYSIQIRGSWTDDKFTVTQVYCSPYKNKILSSDFTPASEQYVDNSIKAAITDALGGSY